MTTEEKLKHFQEICMTDAREKAPVCWMTASGLWTRPLRSIRQRQSVGLPCRRRPRRKSWSVKK